MIKKRRDTIENQRKKYFLRLSQAIRLVLHTEGVCMTHQPKGIQCTRAYTQRIFCFPGPNLHQNRRNHMSDDLNVQSISATQSENKSCQTLPHVYLTNTQWSAGQRSM